MREAGYPERASEGFTWASALGVGWCNFYLSIFGFHSCKQASTSSGSDEPRLL